MPLLFPKSLLFVAELPSFRPVLPSDLLAQMDQFKQEEELKKKEAAAAKKKKKEEQNNLQGDFKNGKKID